MKYTVPDYYSKFACIASDCPATCCAGWQIVIDEKALGRYRKCKTAFGNRLKNSIDWEQKTFKQYNHRCAFLDDRNLCDIYTEAGEDMLCRTCRRYPRHIEEFENERELSLSISCPVAARMILGKQERVTFISKENDKEDTPDDSFDFLLYSALQDCRSVMISVLQDRNLEIGFRIAKVLAIAHDVQNRINGRQLFDAENVLARYMADGADEKLSRRFEKYQKSGQGGACRAALLDILGELEVLNEAWPTQLAIYKERLYGGIQKDQAEENAQDPVGACVDCVGSSQNMWTGSEARVDNQAVRSRALQLMESGSSWRAPEAEQMMVYFIYTYLCGAVYDGDLLAKVKMAVVSTMVIQELELACQMGQEEPIELEDRARIAWSYSRELEHSDLNLNRMEELMNEHEAAEFERLLRSIWDGEV